jgi:hypothetical protein
MGTHHPFTAANPTFIIGDSYWGFLLGIPIENSSLMLGS